MKKILTRLLMLLTIGFTFLNGSCDKDNDPILVPEAEGPKTGFLCTIGRGTDVSYTDTLVYDQRGGQKTLVRLFPGDNDVDEYVTLTPLSGGIWSLKRVQPIISPDGVMYAFFGCYPIGITAGYPPGYSDFDDSYGYTHTVRSTFTPDCEFVVTKDDDDPDLFYLESKLYPGNYLTAAKHDADHGFVTRHLVYGKDKRAFFILKE